MCLLFKSLLAMLVCSATGQPQMCKEYLYEKACADAGCRWVTVGPAAANGPTCTRQCHEFGGAVAAGSTETQIECASPAIGCRWIEHPTNPAVGKCGKLCNEFKVEQNCLLAGYGTCRYAVGDVTGGPPMCTKQCALITDQGYCDAMACIWVPATGKCRRKCIEFQMKAPCESIGCKWVTPEQGYALSQCIPPGPAPGCASFLANQTNSSTKMNSNETFFAEGKTFKWPVLAKGKEFLQNVKSH